MSSVTKLAPAVEIAVPLSIPNILIVDDDEKFLKGAQEYFQTCDFNVDIALTPEIGKQIIEQKEKDYYQLIVTDYDFGTKSEMKGDEFVRENRHLFGKSKIAIISGAGKLTQQIRQKLKEAEDLFLEKNPDLKTKLKEITQAQNAKRADDLEMVVKKEVAHRIEKITGRPVEIKVLTALSRPKRPLPEVAVERLKKTLIKWLKSRGELDEPVLAYGKNVFSANDLIRHVEDETEVGIAHLQLLLRQFESSLDADEDDS
jgi:FixJ family two-component response regulator